MGDDHKPIDIVEEIGLLKGLVRAAQRDVRDLNERVQRNEANVTTAIEQGRIIRERVATLEARVSSVTETSYASHERTGILPRQPPTDLASTLERIEKMLQRLEEKT